MFSANQSHGQSGVLQGGEDGVGSGVFFCALQRVSRG